MLHVAHCTLTDLQGDQGSQRWQWPVRFLFCPFHRLLRQDNFTAHRLQETKTSRHCTKFNTFVLFRPCFEPQLSSGFLYSSSDFSLFMDVTFHNWAHELCTHLESSNCNQWCRLISDCWIQWIDNGVAAYPVCNEPGVPSISRMYCGNCYTRWVQLWVCMFLYY